MESSRLQFIRQQAINTFELTKGFTPEQREGFSNELKTAEELASYVLELTNIEPGAVWVKASERLPGWRQFVKWKSHEGAEVGKHPLFAMTDPGTAEAMDGWEWLDESAAGRKDDKLHFDNWHRWLSDNGYTYDGEYYYDEDNNYFTPDQLWVKFK